jgi:hypothetical protein
MDITEYCPMQQQTASVDVCAAFSTYGALVEASVRSLVFAFAFRVVKPLISLSHSPLPRCNNSKVSQGDERACEAL